MISYVAGPNFRYRCDGRGVRAYEMVFRVAISCLKSSSVGTFTGSSLRWFQSVVVWTQKEFFYCSVSEWGTRKGLEVRAASVFVFDVVYCKVVKMFCWPNLPFVC